MAASINDQMVSIIRTAVPAAIGTVIAYGASKGLNIDPISVNAAIVPLAITLYYAVVRYAEKRHPQLGWLLGFAATPTYTEDSTKGADVPVAPAGQ